MEMTQDSKPDGATRYAKTPSQYLTFRLAEETYAVGILQVREILRYEELTKVPSTPDSIRGVLNLRGSVVPVVDLAVKFGLPSSAVTKWTCIVIVETVLDGEYTVMGILADSVSEVLDLKPDEIEPPTPFGTKVHIEYLVGMGKAERRFILILDIDKVLSAEDVTIVTEALDTIDAPEPDSVICEMDKSPVSVEDTKSKPEMENIKQENRSTEPDTQTISRKSDTKPKPATLSKQVCGISKDKSEKLQNSIAALPENNGMESLEDETVEKKSVKVETKETKVAIAQEETEDKKSKAAGIEKGKDTTSEETEPKADKDENKKKD